MHYVKKKKGEKHIGVIRPRIRVRNEISRFLSSGSTARSVLALLDPSPDSSSCPGQLLRAYFRSKRAKRELYELDPPLLGPQPRILGRSIWSVTSTFGLISHLTSHISLLSFVSVSLTSVSVSVSVSYRSNFPAVVRSLPWVRTFSHRHA